MSTLRVNTIQDSTGSSSPAINGLAKAWVNFNGTGTVAIRASLNVSSITDSSTGQYLVNLTTSMPDTNYAAVLGHGFTNNSGYAYGVVLAETASQVRVNIALDGTGNYDTNVVQVAVFR